MYKNPRLKHVEKIREICSETLYALGTPAHITLIEMQIKSVVKQCNLLLETKKKKKSKHSLPNEKEILGMLDGLTIIVRK